MLKAKNPGSQSRTVESSNPEARVPAQQNVYLVGHKGSPTTSQSKSESAERVDQGADTMVKSASDCQGKSASGKTSGIQLSFGHKGSPKVLLSLQNVCQSMRSS